MSFEVGNKVYLVYEKGNAIMNATVLDANPNNVFVQLDKKGIPVKVTGRNLFHRKELAVHALALLRALREVAEKDAKLHEQDIQEAKAYQDERDQTISCVLDIATEDLGKHVMFFAESSVEKMAAVLTKPIKFGVLNVSPHLKLVRSDSDSRKYYPVTPSNCGCPDHVYRKRDCKHMMENF
jgi:hypothetical protein